MLRTCLMPLLAVVASIMSATAGDAPAPAVAPPTTPAASTPGAAQAPADAAAPDAMFKQVVKGLRGNDLVAVYQALPAEVRTQMEQEWTFQVAAPDPQGDAQLNATLTMLLAPNAVDLLMSQVQPELATLNPQELVAGLQGIAGFLGLAGSQPKDPGVGANLDYAALQAFIVDIAAWVPGAGLNDLGKARKALEHVVAATKTIGIKNSTELRALKLQDLLAKCGPGLKEIKAGLGLYALDADALLDSIAVTKVDGTGDQRTLTITYTAFGHAHALAVKMVKKGDSWAVAEGKDSPFAGLNQLMTLGLMMGQSGDAPGAPAPAPAPKPGVGAGQTPL